MSTELDRALEALRGRADAVVLPPAEEVRQRGDRRRRAIGVTAVAVAVVLVIGVAVGTSVGRNQASPFPAVTPSGSVTPNVTTPAATPEVTPPEQTGDPQPQGSLIPMPPGCDRESLHAAPPIIGGGQTLPDSMMLRASQLGRCFVVYSDNPGYELTDPAHDGFPSPRICPGAEPYAETAHRLAGRSRGFVAGPEVGAYEAVTRFEAGHARAFLAEIRDRVAACRNFPGQDGGAEEHALLLESSFTGDESLLIWVGQSPNPGPDSYPGSYIGVVRRGDVVAVVFLDIDLGSNRAQVRTMTQRAAAHLP